VPHTGHHGHGETDLPARQAGAQRRAGVRGLTAGHGASAEVLWALGWGAAFIVVFERLTMRLYNRKMTLAAAPDTMMRAIPDNRRRRRRDRLSLVGLLKELTRRESHRRQSAISDEFSAVPPS